MLEATVLLHAPPRAATQQPARLAHLKGMALLHEGGTSTTLHMPLARVALCLDCDTCFEITTGQCPGCGSGTFASVARFLERSETA
jgi:hypothetical protein